MIYYSIYDGDFIMRTEPDYPETKIIDVNNDLKLLVEVLPGNSKFKIIKLLTSNTSYYLLPVLSPGKVINSPYDFEVKNLKQSQ
ncbi:MAG: YlzJ-like family protein [Halanaerobiaceae bacterium]